MDDSFELTKKAIKWLNLKKANNNIEEWKLDYKKEDLNSYASKAVPIGINFYLNNLRSMVELSKQYDIDIILTQHNIIYVK